MIRSSWLLEIAGWKTFDAGKKLFLQGAAGEARFENNLLSGVVIDQGKKWKPRLKISSDFKEATNLCNCPETRKTGLLCPHVVALGLQYEKLQAFRQNQPDSPSDKQIPTSTHSPWGKIESMELEKVEHQLRIHLPESFPKLNPDQSLSLSLEAFSVETKKSFPLEASQTLKLSAFDANFLEWLQSFQDRNHPLQARIPQSLLSVFFRKIESEIHLFFLNQRVSVRPSSHHYRLHAKTLPKGDLEVLIQLIEKTPATFAFQNDSWIWNNNTLTHFATLPQRFQKQVGKPFHLTSFEIAHFLQNELPTLSQFSQTTLEIDSYCWDRPIPQLCIRMEGGFRGLSLKSFWKYENLTIPALDSEKPPHIKWERDPQNRFRWLERNLEIEQSWLHQLHQLQFKPSSFAPEEWSCTDPRSIELLLSQELPLWKKTHAIQLGDRLGKLLETVELISPEITLFPDQNGWLSVEVQFQDSQGKNKLSSAEIQQLMQKQEPVLHLKSGRKALVPLKLIEQFQETIRDCHVQSHAQGFRIRKEHAPTLSLLLQKNDWKISSRSIWSPPPTLKELKTIPLSPAFQERLRPYQKQGVQWFHYLQDNQFGGILADEMGLGKTIQTLAFIDFVRDQNPSTLPALVIAPTSLLWNWKSEAEKFAPHLKTLVIDGDSRETLFANIPQSAIVITSYALLRRDIEHYQKQPFSLLFLDEAQHIKNHKSQNAQAAKEIVASHRFVLTGTPLENSVSDLWSIFDFLMPGYLGTSREFKERYETPIVKNEEIEPMIRLRHRVTPFILRRTKKEVTPELPESIEQTLFCDLTQEQVHVYQGILEESRRRVDEVIAKSGEEKSRLTLFSALTRLRQASCHLKLLPAVSSTSWKSPSSKFELLDELLQESYDAGHRVLVFSQFVQLLKLLRQELDQESISYCYLDGESQDRQQQAERFQSDPQIPLFLISLKAGGTGLNLTGADTVIFLDPWWNPAIEAQAIGRAHRIGQQKVVTSFKLIARNTVEEKILHLQKRKKEWIDQTLTDETALLKSLNLQELRSLLS